MILATQAYQCHGDIARRQERALAALASLTGVTAINLQWPDDVVHRDGLRTLTALGPDSRTVTNHPGPRKPITRDALDALAAVAAAEGHRYFCYLNSDIVVAPAAVEAIASAGKQSYAFSRLDVDGAGQPVGMMLYGVDMVAFDVDWWRRNRRRFRPYIFGEPLWDNVYAAVMMCHGDGLVLNRPGLIEHEQHHAAHDPSAFLSYNGLLSALDARHFSIWVGYCEAIVAARARGASVEEEQTIAAEAFVWRRSAGAAMWDAGRGIKARVRYRRQIAAWRKASGDGARRL
jgi:hypothetical protein